MVDSTVVLAAPTDGAEVGELAIGHCAKVALVSLALDFPMGLLDPIGRPVFRLGFAAEAFPLLAPPWGSWGPSAG